MRRSPLILISLSVAAAAAGCARLPRPKPPQAAGPSSQPATRPAAAASRPATWPSYSVSEMKVTELEPQTVLYVDAQTTFRNLPATIDLLMPKLFDAPRQGFAIAGPTVFRYVGATPDLNKAFTLEVGFPVAPGTKPAGPYKVRRDAAPFRAATVTFTGPISMIDKAYDRLVPAVQAAGLKPTDETREVYLVWENPASERNVVLVATGVR